MGLEPRSSLQSGIDAQFGELRGLYDALAMFGRNAGGMNEVAAFAEAERLQGLYTNYLSSMTSLAGRVDTFIDDQWWYSGADYGTVSNYYRLPVFVDGFQYDPVGMSRLNAAELGIGSSINSYSSFIGGVHTG